MFARWMASPWVRAFLVLKVIGLGLGIYAFFIEPDRLVVRRETLALPDWQQAPDLTVAVVTDIHAGAPFIDEAKLRQIVGETNRLRPDLILLPGDFIIQGVLGGTPMEPKRIAAAMAKLSAPLGVWAVLGNHDWWGDEVAVMHAFEKVGIRFLEDRAVKLTKDGRSFWLAGLGDWSDADYALTQRVWDDVPTNEPVLAMTHNPDLFPRLRREVSLLIAGHTHGGQVWVPFLGRPVIPSIYGQRYADGHVVESGRHLFVSSGIGSSIVPVRFMTPPEIALLTLTSVSESSAAGRAPAGR